VNIYASNVKTKISIIKYNQTLSEEFALQYEVWF